MNIRAPAGGAFTDARQTDIRWTATEVEATKHTADDLAATGHLASAAISGAIDAGFKVISLAHVVSTDAAYAAVLATARTVLVAVADTVAAALAIPAIRRTKEAALHLRITHAVAT